MSTFGARLNQALQRRGLRPVEAARLIGIPQGSLSRYLSGQTTPSVQKAQQIATALGIPLAELTGLPATLPVSVVRETAVVGYGAPLTVVLGRLKRRWKTGKNRAGLELAIRAAFEQDAPAVLAWLDAE